MRRVLAAAVLVAFMPTANAQDKGKADFSTNAEYRARYFYMQNPGGDEDTLGSANMAMGRLKLGAMYKASEKLSATATLIHNTNFGIDNNNDAAGGSTGAGTSSTANPTATNTTINDGDNLLSVNEAFVTWMSSEDLNFKVGRMNYTVGDGALISKNDWESIPYSFEGLQVNWEQEWGKLQFVAFKVRNVQTNSAATFPAANTSASGDPEHNMYGLNFDLKTMPEWLKGLNVHIFKDNSDALIGQTGGVVSTSKAGLDTIRYGAVANFAFGPVDLKANYELQGGKVKEVAAGGTKTEMDYKGNMMQVEVGYNLPSFMGSRFHVTYHKDSGDSSSTDTEYGTYDGYYTEKHNSAGAMDLFGWGNLTFTQVGWMMKPHDKTDVGLQYSMFSLTENDTAGNPGYTSGNFDSFPAASKKADADKLGNEIDLWATHHYDNNLSNTFRIGYFMPGERFEATGAEATDKIIHVMIEGKATF